MGFLLWMICFSLSSGSGQEPPVRSEKDLGLEGLANDGDGFGWVVCRVPDVTGDAVDEIAIGAPRFRGSSAGERGAVFLLSGSGLDLVHETRGREAGDLFGYAVAAVDDMDADRRADFLVGAPGGLRGKGYVAVVSGKSGAIIRDLELGEGGAALGRSLAVNEDSTAVLVGGSDEVRLIALSGPAAPHAFRGAPGSDFGRSVAFGPDLDEDGLGDIFVGAPAMAHAVQSGAVLVYASKTRAQCGRVVGSTAGEGFGWSMALEFGDDENDDVLVVGAPLFGGGRGEVRLFELPGLGSRGAIRRGEGDRACFGAAVCIVDDWDDDHARDVAIGAPFALPYPSAGPIGQVEIVSLDRLETVADSRWEQVDVGEETDPPTLMFNWHNGASIASIESPQGLVFGCPAGLAAGTREGGAVILSRTLKREVDFGYGYPLANQSWGVGGDLSPSSFHPLPKSYHTDR